MLNSAQIKELFEKEAVAFLEWEGVPIYRAIELFGIEAVDAGMDEKEGETLYCGYKIEGGYIAWHLLYKGFRKAATYANAEEIKRICIEKELAGKETRAKFDRIGITQQKAKLTLLRAKPDNGVAGGSYLGSA
ncbi:hypothetical protein [Acetobacterium wieringae]|uniref:hypothetical protein n=1 Tax=Acetobacterium wieringae TaxID=52694 RepID=UPI002B217820|nr:hypothetical protein [Acetobacterium wieringae]MEA4805237.1 hypothetical protein [Acetobacterium wieringae]